MIGREQRRTLLRLLLWGIPLLLVCAWTLYAIVDGARSIHTMAAAPAELEGVLRRVLTYDGVQKLRIYHRGEPIGTCRFVVRPADRSLPESAHVLRCTAELDLTGGRPLEVVVDTGLDEDFEVQNCRIRAESDEVRLRAAAALAAGQIVWELEAGETFRIQQRTPIRTLDGLALAGPLGLPGLGNQRLADSGAFDRLAAAPPQTTVRLDQLYAGASGICYVVETKWGGTESVSTWVRPDGQIARLESSFGFRLKPDRSAD